MTEKKDWFITGAGRGMGVDIAKAALAGGNSMNGLQGGDPAKLADALIQLASQDRAPLRWIAGADAVKVVEQKAQDLLAQVHAYRELSTSLALEDSQQQLAGSQR